MDTITGTTTSKCSFTAQIEFGILPLHIETRRFRNLKPEDRICTLCQLNEVEDEVHFLFRCSCYNIERNEWLKCVTEKCSDFLTIDVTLQMKCLFNDLSRCTVVPASNKITCCSQNNFFREGILLFTGK